MLHLQLVTATFVFGFRLHLELSALHNLDELLGLGASTDGNILDLVDNVHSLEHFTKNDVFAIEPAGDNSGDEELGAVAGEGIRVSK